jgi:hypothetical protein
LVLESDEDTESIVRFERVGDEVGIVGCSKSRLAASPTRVLVLRPASLTQSSRELFVDVRAVVAIVLDVVGAEVVLQDVVGHGDAIVKMPLSKHRNSKRDAAIRLARLTRHNMRATVRYVRGIPGPMYVEYEHTYLLYPYGTGRVTKFRTRK